MQQHLLLIINRTRYLPKTLGALYYGNLPSIAFRQRHAKKYSKREKEYFLLTVSCRLKMENRHNQQRTLDHNIAVGCANLLEQIDKRVLVVLRDGRTFIGILRSVDQFANLLLQDSVERIHVGDCYGDIQRGIFIVRGDSVVLSGEVDEEKERNAPLKKVAMDIILEAQQKEQDVKAERDSRRSQALRDRGLSFATDGIAEET